MAKKEFQIQVPTSIVRNNGIGSGEFVLLAKLIDAYYGRPERTFDLSIDYKALMFYLSIKDNNTFKKRLNNLHSIGYIIEPVDKLPRKGALIIKLNPEVVPELKKGQHFTQLPRNVTSKKVIDAVGDTGVRLLYYFKSYINTKQLYKDKCSAAIETIAEHLNIEPKTVIKYSKLLEKKKFIKITQHKVEHETEYHPVSGNEMYLFFRYNNQYYLRLDKIEEFCLKSA